MRSEAIYWRVVPFLLSGLVLPGFLQAYYGSSIACGTLVGQTMAAAAWLALGPMVFHWRFFLSRSREPTATMRGLFDSRTPLDR